MTRKSARAKSTPLAEGARAGSSKAATPPTPISEWLAQAKGHIAALEATKKTPINALKAMRRLFDALAIVSAWGFPSTILTEACADHLPPENLRDAKKELVAAFFEALWLTRRFHDRLKKVRVGPFEFCGIDAPTATELILRLAWFVIGDDGFADEEIYKLRVIAPELDDHSWALWDGATVPFNPPPRRSEWPFVWREIASEFRGVIDAILHPLPPSKNNCQVADRGLGGQKTPPVVVVEIDDRDWIKTTPSILCELLKVSPPTLRKMYGNGTSGTLRVKQITTRRLLIHPEDWDRAKQAQSKRTSR